MIRDFMMQRLPELTNENLTNIMNERKGAAKNTYTSIPIQGQGYLEIYTKNLHCIFTSRKTHGNTLMEL